MVMFILILALDPISILIVVKQVTISQVFKKARDIAIECVA
jgi:hypothetical protein